MPVGILTFLDHVRTAKGHDTSCPLRRFCSAGLQPRSPACHIAVRPSGASANTLRAAKADHASLKLQNEFYEKSHHPVDHRLQRG
jgi:hypothetical protein